MTLQNLKKDCYMFSLTKELNNSWTDKAPKSSQKSLSLNQASESALTTQCTLGVTVGSYPQTNLSRDSILVTNTTIR